MNDFSHLISSKVNLALVQELALNELIEILNRCDGTKVNKVKIFENKIESQIIYLIKLSILGSNVG